MRNGLATGKAASMRRLHLLLALRVGFLVAMTIHLLRMDYFKC